MEIPYGSVAQLVERWPEEPSVVGSIPTGPTKYGSIVYGRLGCNPLKVMNLVRPQMELLKYGTVE